MDPADPNSFTHKTLTLPNDRTYHFVDEVPQGHEPGKSNTLLLLHGFPDFWYGWRFQIGPWVRNGFRVIAPDMLGYGGTSHPNDPSEYAFKKISSDLASLLDALHIDSVVVVGHDWGAVAAYKFCQWQPTRAEAVITLAVPFTPTPDVDMRLEDIVAVIPKFGYQLFFASPDSPEILEKHLTSMFDILYQRQWPSNLTEIDVLKTQIETSKPEPSDLLTAKERSYYLETFRKSGMRGPTNYYRTTQLRYKEEKDENLPKYPRASLPALFFCALDDPVVREPMVKIMEDSVPRFDIVRLDDCAHFVMVEKKEDVVEKVIDWVKSLPTKNP